MAWVLKSSETNTSYNFDDNVTEDEALKYVESIERPAETLAVAAGAVKNIIPSMVKAKAGVGQFAGDIGTKLGIPGAPQVAEDARLAIGEIERETAANLPENMSIPQKGLASAITSVPESLALMGATALTGGLAAPFMGLRAGMGLAAAGGLATGAAGEGFREYGSLRQTKGVGESALRAVPHAAAGFIGEKFAAKPFLDVLKEGAFPGIRQFVKQLFMREVTGEELTTVMQFVNRYMWEDKNMSAGEVASRLMEDMAVTGIAAGLGGGVQAGLGAGVAKGAEALGGAAAAPTRVEPTLPDFTPEIAPQPEEALRSSREEVQKTELPWGGETVSEAGVIAPAGMPEYPPIELPLDLRIQRLEQLEQEINAQPPVDFNTTTEERIERAKARQFVEQERSMLTQEIEANPELKLALLKNGTLPARGLTAVQYQLETQALEVATENAGLKELKAKQAEREMMMARDGGVAEPAEALAASTRAQIYDMLEPGYPEIAAAKGLLQPTELKAYGQGIGADLPTMVAEMQAGDVRYAIGTDMQAPANVETSAQMQKVLQSWVNILAPDMKVILAEVAETHPLVQGRKSSHLFAGDAHVIVVPKQQNMWEAGSILAHEFGHGVLARLYESADAATQKALANAYLETKAQLRDMSFREGVKLIAGPARAKELIQMAEVLHIADDKFYEAMALTLPDQQSKTYVLSFDEWLAESMSKYMHTRMGVTPEAKSFFEKMLQVFARMFQKAKEYAILPPNTTFTQWVDGVVLRNARDKSELIAGGDTKKLQQDLIANGVQPDVAKVIAAPGAEAVDFQEVERLTQAFAQAAISRKANAQLLAPQTGQMLRGLLPLMRKANVYGRDKSKAQVLKTMRAAIDKDAKELWDKVQDIAMSPEFDTQFVDAQKLLATVMTRLGGWRVENETVIDSPDGEKAVSVKLRTLGGSISVGYLQNPGNEATVEFDLPADAKESEKVQTVLGALHSMARQGVKHWRVQSGQVELQRMLANFTKGIVLLTSEVQYTIPYWAYEMNEKKDQASVQFGGTPAEMLARVGKYFGNSTTQRGADALGRFNTIYKYGLGAFQLLKLNINVPGALEIRQGFRNRMKYRSEWLRPADAAVDAWQNLNKAEAEGLSKLFFDEAQLGDMAETSAGRQAAWMSTRMDDPERPGRKIYMLKPEAMKKYGLSEKAAKVYSQVRDFYTGALFEMEKVGLAELARTHFDPMTADIVHNMITQGGTKEQVREFINQRIDQTDMLAKKPESAKLLRAQMKDMQEQFQELGEKPYTPYPRFGQYATIVREGNKVVYFETFETERERDAATSEIAQMHPGMQVARTYLEDTVAAYQGVPPSFMEAIAQGLKLTPEQLIAFKDIQFAQMNANAFLQKMRKRKKTAGYTEDAMRGFADYSRKFSNHVARVKSQTEIRKGLGLMEQYAKDIERQDEGNSTKIRKLHEWFTETNRYINEVGNELGEVKSFVSLWHFGFNISSAAVNTLQVPMVTLPYLSERFGVPKAVGELQKAYRDLAKWDLEGLDDESRWVLEEGLKAGFVNESFATTLAQAADGDALTSVQPLQSWRRKLGRVNHYAMWMFQKAEEVNRRTTVLAAFRLAREQGMSQEDAFDFARGAVEDTQGEYAIENRPKFMRGNWSVIFQFMQFQQNMLFQMFGGDKSWKRLLATHLMIAGVMGMPLAGDLASVWKLLWRKLGEEEKDIERMAREMLSDMNVNPSLILRGLSSNVMGFDLSRRVSMGDVVPGMQAIGAHQKFNQAMSDAAGDLAGPGIGLVINAMRFIAEDDPRILHRMQKIMPSAMRNMTKAIEAEIAGGVKDRDGALLYDPDIWESVGYAAGFMPKELSQEYNARTLTNEVGTYWTRRRQTLLELYNYAAVNGKDVGEVANQIVEFNSKAPDRNLIITSRTLRESQKQRQKVVERKAAGLGANRMTDELSQQLRSTFQ